MKNHDPKSFSITILIGIISASLITFQLHLINILSITQWYHFAYMVIAIALLGFGTSGTLLSLLKDQLILKINILLPILILLTHIFISVSVTLSQTELFYFDSYRLFTDFSYLIKLPTYYLLFFLPFFFGSLIIGLLFVNNAENIGVLYFANMSGSGIGAVLALILMWIIPPESLASVISTLSLITCVIVLAFYSKKGYYLILVSTIPAIILINLESPRLRISEYKSLSKILNLPESEIIETDFSPYGNLVLVNSPFLRYSPGLSMLYSGEVTKSNSALNNGNWQGPLLDSGRNRMRTFNYSTENLPYILSERKSILNLYSGTGTYLQQALSKNTDRVVAIEPNSRLTNLLKTEYSHLVDSIYNHPKIVVRNVFPRSYILRSEEKFDLIQLPIIDAFGGTSGLTSLKEDYLMTKDSFSEMIAMLNDSGVISISTWIDYPYRNSLKIISTLAEALTERGIINPQFHIVAVKNWNTVTIIAKRKPIDEYERNSVIDFCEKMNFDPVILGGYKVDNRNHYNKLHDSLFFSYIDDILESTAEREDLYSQYPFNIKPATDSKPYFSQFLKWESLNLLAEHYGNRLIPFFEIGYVLLYITFIQILLIAVILIIVPVFFFKKISMDFSTKSGKNFLAIFFYFSGIGLGYIFYEIICIQRFLLYFGNIFYSTAFVIGLLLISSGLGSLYSQKFGRNKIKIRRLFITAIILIAVTLIILEPVIKLTIDLNLFIKVLISILFIFPSGFFMGMPFPLGIRIIGENNSIYIPWAWGINGIFSVIGVVLATIISVEIGFVWLLFFTLLSYFISMLSQEEVVRNASTIS